jgi:hypothetical protein
MWMWGLFSIQEYDLYSGYTEYTRFTQSPIEIVLSIISTMLVLVSALFLISKANSSRKYGTPVESWLKLSILLIIGTIIWPIGLEITSLIDYGSSFWTYIDPGFGVIGPVLGSVLSLIGYGAYRMSPKRTQEMITPMKRKFIVQPQQDTPVSHSFRFCPSCGDRIIQADQQFCINCGFNLKRFKQV